MTPGFHYYEADGTALNVYDITGATRARVIQCLKSSKPSSGFDQDLSRFEDLADPPAQGGQEQGGHAPEAPELDLPAPAGGRLPTIQEEEEGDLEARIVETWYTELMEEFVMAESVPSKLYAPCPPA